MKLGATLSSWVVLISLTIGGLVAAPLERVDPPRAAAITEAELGRLLFWDPIMSGNKAVACATCHHPDLAYADARDLSLGFGAVGMGAARIDASNGAIPVVKRNAPTIVNAVFNGIDGEGRRRRAVAGLLQTDRGTVLDPTTATGAGPMFWDSRVDGLEAQALEPLKAFEEMRGTTYPEEVAVDSVVARLRSIPEYVTLFQEVYGPATEVDASQLARSIVAFERTLVAVNTPFDRFRAGDRTAMTEQQIRGEREFDQAGCDRCHTGLMFSDFDLHAEGVAENTLLTSADAGDGRFRFRTPSLRNVALTAPYMHNGVLATLEDVLRFYDAGRSENPNVTNNGGRRGANNDGGLARLDNDFRRVDNLSDQEQADIVAFLHALTDESFDRTIPQRVPSGLRPGGAIGDPQQELAALRANR